MLGRRNLDRADRDEMIRRLAARGVKQKNIAEKTGLSKGRITQIVSESNSLEVKHESSINATTPAAEIEAKQAKLDSLRKRLKDEQAEHDTPGPITENNVPGEFIASLKGAAFTLLYDIEGNNPYESNALIVVGAARLS